MNISSMLFYSLCTYFFKVYLELNNLKFFALKFSFFSDSLIKNVTFLGIHTRSRGKSERILLAQLMTRHSLINLRRTIVSIKAWCLYCLLAKVAITKIRHVYSGVLSFSDLSFLHKY